VDAGKGGVLGSSVVDNSDGQLGGLLSVIHMLILSTELGVDLAFEYREGGTVYTDEWLHQLSLQFDLN
jgi:hypothetical protein